MTQRSYPTSRSLPFAVARPHHHGWRGAAGEELDLIRAWFRSGMSRGLEWLLQIGVPTAATVLEMQNVKRRIPEIGEIEQAVQSARARSSRRITRTSDRSPFED
jgi:hypothetical protein